MAEKSLAGMIRHIRHIGAVQTSRELSDADLLQRFVEARDEAAFTALVERHGSLVLGVCHRALGNPHDAEDACQATFLVLARSAATVRKTASLSCWLHRVARSVAANLRRERFRREQREHRIPPPVVRDTAGEIGWREVQAALDEEIARLPERYRAPIILCYLDGKTRDEAATRLALSPGTLHGRLERGRRMLCERLTRRGLTLSATLLATAVGEGAARAIASPTLVLASARAALAFAARDARDVGGVSARTLSLAREGFRGAIIGKLRVAAAVTLCAGLLLTAGDSFSAAEQPAPDARTSAKNVANAAPAAVRSLEGTWQAVAVEVNGKRNTSEEATDLQMIFSGDAITLKSISGLGGERKQKFKLRPDISTVAIDLTSLDGQEKGQTTSAIYSLKNDVLTLCFARAEKGAGARPGEFKTREGDGRILIEMVRKGAKRPGATAGVTRADDPARAEFATIQREWQKAEDRYGKAFDKAKTAEERQKLTTELKLTANALAERSLKVADGNPENPVALTCLFWSYGRARNTDTGEKALALLRDGRIARARFDELADALTKASVESGRGLELAPLVLERAKQNLDHPRAVRALIWVCNRYYKFPGDKATEAPRPFAAAAEIIVDRFADSPEISNFCECLAPADSAPPPWALKFERHLKTIQAKNHDRLVRVTSSFALASILMNAAGESRQKEGLKLLEQFVKDFDGSDPKVAAVEDVYLYFARAEVKRFRLLRPGMPAPEIEGKNLDGGPMRLSQFRGKVVLLSFWATSCAPCMKLIPHERALAERLKDKPFAIIGVNSDSEDAEIKKVLLAQRINWPSFRDQRTGKSSISADWQITGIPTLYLIDSEGIIRKCWCDAPPTDEFNQTIDQLIEATQRKK